MNATKFFAGLMGTVMLTSIFTSLSVSAKSLVLKSIAAEILHTFFVTQE
jgi:hypothetical protein